jgi:hypothetical protein
MSITPSLYAKARSEIIALFGWNAEGLSPDQTLRLDCAVSLRLALDDLQGRIVRGESADVARMLTASEALARLLPPAVLAAPPSDETHHQDPRVALWNIIKEGRDRLAEGEEGYDGLVRKVERLEAENERLRTQLTGAGLTPALPDATSSAWRNKLAIDPPLSDIVPPSERAECDAGPSVGLDDPPKRAPVTIEGKANPPAAPQYDYSKEQGWRDYVEPDGSIRSTPRGRGHYWGPV